jgi:hypothetical protein
MKFLPILGTLLFLVVGQFAIRTYGAVGGVAALSLMLVTWFGSYVWKERIMDRIWREFSRLPQDKQTEILAHSDEAFCTAMARRNAKKEPSPVPTRGKGT